MILRHVFFAIFLFFGFQIQADQSCRYFYAKSVENSQKAALAYSIQNRLYHYFDEKADHTQIEVTTQILIGLSVRGSIEDLKIFDLYLSVLESIPGSKKLFNQKNRVQLGDVLHHNANIFQEQHWNWEQLYDYFFVSPLTLNFHREQDIVYLKHVLETAKGTPGPKTLRDVLQKSNQTWASKQLVRFPDIDKEYQSYVQGKSQTILYLELKDHFARWADSGSNDMIRGKRWEQIWMTLESLRVSNNSFDLFLANKYLDMIELYSTKEQTASFDMPLSSLHMTDWDIHIVGLPLGNLDTMNQFIIQNSHDIASKAYAAKTLNMMNSIAPRLKGKKRYNFRDAYYIALKLVDRQIPKIAAPDFYQSDLHIYSRNRNPGITSADDAEQVWVRWNPILGRPVVTVVERYSYQLNKDLKVRDYLQLHYYVRAYFDNFRKSGAYKKEEIDFDENMEMNASIFDTAYFVYSHPNSYTLLSMARLFDAKDSKTFIERELGNIEIPERKTGEHIYELGRLLATEEADGNSLELIMARVAHYLKAKNATGVIYLNASEAGMRRYRRVNAKVVYTPDQLNLKPGATPLWVMKYTVDDFINQFLKPDFQTVRTRRK